MRFKGITSYHNKDIDQLIIQNIENISTDQLEAEKKKSWWARGRKGQGNFHVWILTNPKLIAPFVWRMAVLLQRNTPSDVDFTTYNYRFRFNFSSSSSRGPPIFAVWLQWNLLMTLKKVCWGRNLVLVFGSFCE